MNKDHPRVSDFEFDSFFAMIACPKCKENQIVEDCDANSAKDVECCFCNNKFSVKFGNYQRLEYIDENYRR